jgi:ribose 5-phosphate isomerase B
MEGAGLHGPSVGDMVSAMATTPDEVRAKVREVVYRTLGLDRRSQEKPRSSLVTERDVRDLPFGSRLEVAQGRIVTPLARQVAMDRHVRSSPRRARRPASRDPGGPRPRPVVAIGADHGGYPLKEVLKGHLRELGFEVVDCGTSGTEAVDYPDFALAVAELVAQGRAWRGILVDGAGIGSCMAANKVPGVRAALCHDQATALNSREHNDANVLTLGAGLTGESLARQIVKTWIETPFAAGRHARRVAKIGEIEGRFARRG